MQSLILILSFFMFSKGTYAQSLNAFKAISFSNIASVFKIKNNDLYLEFCKNFDEKILQVEVTDEKNNVINSKLYFNCDINSNRTRVVFEIFNKQVTKYNDLTNISKLTNGNYLLSSDKFRLQVNVSSFSENEKMHCEVILYDVVNNLFFNSNNCKINFSKNKNEGVLSDKKEILLAKT